MPLAAALSPFRAVPVSLLALVAAVATLAAAPAPAAAVPAVRAGAALAGLPGAAPAAGLPGARPADVERALRDAWERLEVVVEQYNDVREDLKETRERAAALEARIAPLREAMRDRQVSIGGLAARAYRAGGAAQVNTLLAATSPEQFVDRLTIVHRLTSQQYRALGSLAEARDRFEATRQQLTTLADDQRRHQARLAETRRHIEAEIRRLEALRDGAGQRRPRPADRHRAHAGYVPAYPPGSAGVAIRFAQQQLGKPYRWGGGGPDGYDCSGLTSAAWRKAGVRLPHNSARQWHAVRAVSRAELRPGDIVFYYRDIHHVGLYVGDGRIIHAPSHGERIRVEDVGYAPIYGYGRP